MALISLQCGKTLTSESLITVKELFDTAVDHHRNGRVADAEQGYRAVLTHDSEHADTLHYLGVLVHQKGTQDEAADLIRRAIALNPENPIYHSNLGNVLVASGQVEDAAHSFETATRLKPDFAQAHSNLGTCLHKLGRIPEAEQAARAAVQLQPELPDAQFTLGNILMSEGKATEALACASAAIALQPDHALAQALAGSALFAVGRAGDSLAYFDRAVDLNPNDPVIHMNRGNALLEDGRLEEAISACRHAVRINPNLAVALAVMGGALKQQGRIAEARSAYRNAMTADPGLASAHSDLLFTLQYDLACTPQDGLAEARNWNTTFTTQLKAPQAPETTPVNHGPLRVGYVSADLRTHSVSYFMTSVLKLHDPEKVEVFCYTNAKVEDGQTQKFKSWSRHWANIVDMDDDQAANLIRTDGIEILVDLSGHTGGNRLALFARRPAPLQITYLGYPATTGLNAIDYRLTDAVADPEGSSDRDYSETLVRLPRGFLCYTPPDGAPDPKRDAGPLTFGSFNNVPKINQQVVAVWARILRAMPDAHLLLKHRSYSDQATRRRYIEMFTHEGIDPDSVTMTGFVDGTEDHLAIYNKVDVALDTFPYNGTTTTAEALWMGVPVVTVLGDRHAARVGGSILSHAGLPELIARDLDHYVALAVEIAGDQNKLKSYRAGLRGKLAKSLFLDGPGFTRALEDTYRRLWQQRSDQRQ